MGKRFIISESEKEDIKSKHEIDIDQKLFTYLRRNLKFKKENILDLIGSRILSHTFTIMKKKY